MNAQSLADGIASEWTCSAASFIAVFRALGLYEIVIGFFIQ